MRDLAWVAAQVRRVKWLFEFRAWNKKQTHAGRQRGVGLVVSSFVAGGLEQVVLNLYKGYRAAGVPAWILVEENILGPIAQKVAPEHLIVFARDPARFLEAIRQNDIGTLHYHYNTYMMRGAAAMGFRLIYTIHNVYTWKDDMEMARYSRLLHCADHLVAVSSYVKEYYLARCAVPPRRISVIPNGIDLRELQAPAPCPVTRESLGFLPEDRVVVMCASIHEVKHQIGMLGVMERLHKEHPHLKLVFLGGDGQPDYTAAFLNALQNSPAKASMRRVAGIPHVCMGTFLRDTADIVILPTLQEGCSNAVLEALCCAKPMIVTKVGNAADIAFDKGCIVVPAAYEGVPPPAEQLARLARQKTARNTEALVQALAEIDQNYEYYCAEAQKAAQKAPEFDQMAMVQRYIKLMECGR